MLDFDKYKNNVKYPNKKDYKIYECECEEKVPKENNFCGSCGADQKERRFNEQSRYDFDYQKYRDAEKERHERFKKDALEEVGLLDHPKADKIYHFAWEHGHSCGLYEVYYWLEELSELFEE